MENSTTHPRIVPITQTYQPVLRKPVFVAALAIFGVFYILAGIINLVTAIILFSNVSMPSLVSSTLTDAAYKLCLGALTIASTVTFSKGRLLSIWLYAVGILLSSLYSLIMGYPVNYFFVGFGLLMIWQIWKYKDQLELK